MGVHGPTEEPSSSPSITWARLADGTLVGGFPRLPEPVKIGMDQSMGGHFIIHAQGQQAPFDAVGVLGYSSIHTVIAVPPGEDSMLPPALARKAPAENLGIWAEKVAANADLFQQRMYYLSFFDENDAGAVRQKFITPAFSRTTPGAAKYMLSRGVVAEEAARIECPVFLGFGAAPPVGPVGRLESAPVSSASSGLRPRSCGLGAMYGDTPTSRPVAGASSGQSSTNTSG